MKTSFYFFLGIFSSLFITVCKKDDPKLFPDEPIDFNIIDSEPAWSPDGNWIAFSHSGVSDKSGIYLVSPDGNQVQQWHAGYAENPSWSTCGQWIAFSQGVHIWKKKINGDSLMQLTFQGRNFFPTWSSDGKYIAYTQTVCNEIPCGLWLFELTNSTCRIASLYGMFPNSHPSQSKILYSKRWIDRSGQVVGDSLFYFDYLQGAASFITSLKDPTYDNRYLKINSKGEKIVFTSQPLNGRPQIWAMNIDGTNKKQLTQIQSYSCDWSPNGLHIVYTDAQKGRLWVMDSDGRNKHQLTFEHHFNP
ncbi:MAG: hypothetical protein AB9846_17730 [Tenuifilaceae bacterium]